MKLNLRYWRFGMAGVGILLATSGSSLAAATPSPTRIKVASPQPVRRVNLTQWTDQQIKKDLAQLASDGQFGTMKTKLGKLEDQVIAYMPHNGLVALRHADFARRLVSQLSSISNARKRLRMLKFLMANPELAGTMVFLNTPGQRNTRLVYHRLAALHRELGPLVVAYPNLTAAICVVLYKPLLMHINENTVHSPNPVALFKYYVRYQRAMYFGIRKVPARLLIYVVDSCSSIRSMTWALNKYHGDAMVGQLFFRVPYDYSTYLHGAKKEVDIKGYNLPNIVRYGGVCADQAFFASEVGKAIGVPTAYDTGMSGVVGHAWVGFLQQVGNQAAWNFSVGRYSEYRGVVGIVQNPVTRRPEPDSFMSLSSQFIGTTQHQRWNAVALTDAALRLLSFSATHGAFLPAPPPVRVFGRTAKPLTNSVATQLSLLRWAVHECDGYADSWMLVGYLASKGKLTLAEKKLWAGAVMRLCGLRYPDFAMTILQPMIMSVKKPKQQNEFWNRAYALFAATHFDLAAQVRMMQARLWRKAGHYNRAGICLMDVINRYANAGPFIITALHEAAQILRRQKHNGKITTLYEITWSRIKPPPRMADPFMHESNWYKVGKLLENRLRRQGQTLLADKVRRELLAAGNPVAGTN
ncbi:MAG: hypothetical protein ACP5I8_15745 [Phycisphaerae bacterium]